MKAFEPEYHEGMEGGCYYAIPGRRSGVGRLSEPRLHERCWTVYRETICTNLVFDTYDEANEKAEELATEEVLAMAKAKAQGWKGRPIYGHYPGRVPGMLEDDEEAA